VLRQMRDGWDKIEGIEGETGWNGINYKEERE
jgi:hypothetical protein